MMIADSAIYTFFYASFILSLAYLALLYALVVLHLVIAVFENLTRKTDSHSEDYEALMDSRFTIPVSLIVPAYNEEVGIVSVIQHLQRLDYPEYEIIVVNDGSRDRTHEVLEESFDLEPVELSYRKILLTKSVRRVYRSKTEPRLLIVDKSNGGKADALNCGINFARYRYVCCLDGDTIYRPAALLAGMRLAMKDPATVLGVTSLVAVGRRPDIEVDSDVGQKSVDPHLLVNLQHLEIIRAFINNRLAWSRLGVMLCVSGAFAIWRRDVILEVGGFSPEFTCEDLEITVRVLERYRREGRPAQILAMPDMVGITEGPETISALVSQRARWQRVTLETVWHYRRMMLNPRYGLMGMLAMPYVAISECIGSLMQIVVVVSLVLGAVFGVIDWVQFFAIIGIQVFAIGIMSSVGLWMNDWSFRYYRLGDLIRLTLIAPLDFFCYRPILVFAYAKGCIEFLRGDKRWHRFARNVRPKRRQSA